MMPKGKRPRGVCPGCRREVVVNVDGFPRVHRNQLGVMCPGELEAWRSLGESLASSSAASKGNKDQARAR